MTAVIPTPPHSVPVVTEQMKQSFILTSIAITLVNAHPANDWNKPCFEGHCAYDLHGSAESGSGTLKIFGPSTAISDITPAAGWIILGCDPKALAQDIRLVCKNDDGAGCDHLFQNSGPVDKLVRLPEKCGGSAFARISKSWVPEDQSIPSSIHPQIARRDGLQPQVKAISIDTNFDEVDVSKTGTISFAIQGANIPGAESDFVATTTALQSRDGTDFIETALERFADWDINKQFDLPTIDINKNFNILDQHQTCGPISGSLKIDVTGKAHAVVTIGIAASGTIFPPKVKKFGAFAGLNADLDGGVNLVASLSGSMDTGVKKLYTQKIPGLSFEGLITVNPSFELDAQAKANLEPALDLNFALNYRINAQLYFPPSVGKRSGGTFRLQNTPLKLSASPAAQNNVEAHLIPRINFGLSALKNIGSAVVFLQLDTSATLELAGSRSTGVSSSTQRASDSSAVSMIESGISSAVANKPYTPPYGASLTRTVVTRNSSSSASVCADIKAGLDVSVGVIGDFLSLLDPNMKVSLYNKHFELLKKCFGSTAKKRMVSRRSLLETHSVELSCPRTTVSTAIVVVDETVNAASVPPT